MEDRITPGLYLEMTTQAPEAYEKQRVPRLHQLPEHAVALLPRHHLQALTGGGSHLHLPRLQRHTEMRTGIGAVSLPARRIGMDAVIHMDG